MHYVTAGESHGPWEIAVIEGFPAGLKITEEEINLQLKRRQHGYGRGNRQKIEHDQVKFLSGVRHQYTLGSPITMAVKNLDYDNWREIMSANTPADSINTRRQIFRPRPGHADLTGAFKYKEHNDLRNILERSSARETTMRVAVGAICKKLLQELKIDVLGFVEQIGSVKTLMEDLEKFKDLNELQEQSESFPTRTLDKKTDQAMRDLIDKAKKSGDTLGGTVIVLATGVPAGLGSYVSAQTKLDAKIARAIVSINAFKGVDFGDGFKMADRMGSELMDEIFWSKKRGFYRATNHLGGFEGGMTTGEMIVVRGLVKPIPTLYRPLKSVDLNTHEPHSASVERSDTTAVTVGAVIAEAMVAIELTKEILAQFNSDHLDRLKEQVACFRKELRNF